MSTDPDPIEVTLLVTRAFDQLRVPYLVVGSLASSYYGVSRSSLDSDIVASLKMNDVPGLVSHLGKDFYLDENSAMQAIRLRGSFNLVHRPTMFKVDIFMSKEKPFDRRQLEGRRELNLDAEGQRRVYIASAEDTVLAKLDWFRQGNETSDRQWQDVLGILRVQKERLDMGLLRDWAPRIGVADLLSKALVEVGIE